MKHTQKAFLFILLVFMLVQAVLPAVAEETTGTSDTIDITVSKEWLDANNQPITDDTVPGSIPLTLKSNNNYYNDITLYKDNAWQETISSLPHYDKDVNLIYYRVEEPSLDGWKSTVTNTAPQVAVTGTLNYKSAKNGSVRIGGTSGMHYTAIESEGNIKGEIVDVIDASFLDEMAAATIEINPRKCNMMWDDGRQDCETKGNCDDYYVISYDGFAENSKSLFTKYKLGPMTGIVYTGEIPANTNNIINVDASAGFSIIFKDAAMYIRGDKAGESLDVKFTYSGFNFRNEDNLQYKIATTSAQIERRLGHTAIPVYDDFDITNKYNIGNSFMWKTTPVMITGGEFMSVFYLYEKGLVDKYCETYPRICSRGNTRATLESLVESLYPPYTLSAGFDVKIQIGTYDAETKVWTPVESGNSFVFSVTDLDTTDFYNNINNYNNNCNLADDPNCTEGYDNRGYIVNTQSGGIYNNSELGVYKTHQGHFGCGTYKPSENCLLGDYREGLWELSGTLSPAYVPGTGYYDKTDPAYKYASTFVENEESGDRLNNGKIEIIGEGNGTNADGLSFVARHLDGMDGYDETGTEQLDYKGFTYDSGFVVLADASGGINFHWTGQGRQMGTRLLTETIRSQQQNLTVVNTPTQKIEITKIWDDAGHEDERPEVKAFITGNLVVDIDGNYYRITNLENKSNDDFSSTYTATLTPKESPSGLPDYEVIVRINKLKTTNDTWTIIIDDLPKYKAGDFDKPEDSIIKYEVEEELNENYYIVRTGENLISPIITNHWNKTTVEGEKSWDDEGYEQYRPDSITIHLHNTLDREAYKELTISKDDDGNWPGWKFEDLPIYKSETEKYTYYVHEVEPDNYREEDDNDLYNILNVYDPEHFNLTVRKEWDDHENRDGQRPDKVQFILKLTYTDNGESVTKYIDANGDKHDEETKIELPDENNKWNRTIKLERENNYTYTIEEVYAGSALEDRGYKQPTITGSIQDGNVIFTNSRDLETVQLKFTKSWDETADYVNQRPAIINLLKNLRLIGWRIDDDGPTDDWQTFGLKYIEQVVQDDDNPNKFTTKALVANVFHVTVEVTVQEGTTESLPKWEIIIDGLPKHRLGDPIRWDIQEYSGDYELIIKEQDLDEADDEKFIIEATNYLNWDQLKLQKIWKDGTGSHRPEPLALLQSLTLKAKLANGGEVDYSAGGFKQTDTGLFTLWMHPIAEIKVNTTAAENTWTIQMDKLPRKIDGSDVSEWTVTENLSNYKSVVVAGSEDSGFDFVITNQLIGSVTVIKYWNDGNNQDGLRKPATIQLLSDGEPVEGQTATVETSNGWSYTFKNLPKINEDGEEIRYSVSEEAIPGYENPVIDCTGDPVTTCTVTNTHTPETIDIRAVKIWDDNNNEDGLRPSGDDPRVGVYLLKDGNRVKTGEYGVSTPYKYMRPDERVDENTWVASRWMGLPKYENGVEIKWSVEEVTLENYTVTGPVKEPDHVEIKADYPNSDWYIFTNTLTVTETTEVSVTKEWQDYENARGTRPASVTVHLWADYHDDEEESVDTGKSVILPYDNEWSYTFTNLPHYRNGKPVSYTVKEDDVEGYEIQITGDADSGFVITNVIEANPTIDIPVQKVWSGDDDNASLRPDRIFIELIADGEDTGKFIELSKDNQWKNSFTDQPLYRAEDSSEKIVYSVEENGIPSGYETTIEENEEGGFIITNVYVPSPTVNIPVRKVWDDDSDSASLRPDSVTVKLLIDTGKSFDLNSQIDWNDLFKGLPKYDESGEEIVYTVQEVGLPEGFTGSVDEDGNGGFIITNTYQNNSCDPNPTPAPAPEFFRLNVDIPETGLCGAGLPLSAKPLSVNYTPLRMELQIPSLKISADIVKVTAENGRYPVEWLGENVALLDGTAMPGKGISVIAAHNTLNKDEFGPFALISGLEVGDHFFIRDDSGNLMIYEVYANGKIDGNDKDALLAQASAWQNSLTLLTCEDERAEGGYASRRIVSARELN